MSAFDKVIGYETIKNELQQACDMIQNEDIYVKLGARPPQGILLHGEPGLGKTLLAECFIAESGLKFYTVRKNKGSDDFVGEITATFQKAKDNAPAIVFLDDMDKFANEDDFHRDAEEYVAVQAGIDEVKGSSVFVIATANDVHKLPHSLMRSGRFDRKLELRCPTEADARKIIEHYLIDKKVSADVDLEDFSRMINFSSCAELETILNEAAISAAYARRPSITMKDLTGAVLRMEYEAPDCFSRATDADMRRIALHEAGHLVVSEVLCPGSVGLASLQSSGRNATGGFVRRCKELPQRTYHILVSLGGKAAGELYYADEYESGCKTDIKSAIEQIREAISESGVCGFGAVEVETFFSPSMSESLNARSEALIHAELERFTRKAKDILLKNRAFLEATADALLTKETLLYSDIKALRESVTITEVAV